MVLLGRIELPTSALPRMRSTTELQQHTISARPDGYKARQAGARFGGEACICQGQACERQIGAAQMCAMMDKTQAPAEKPALSREERLAQRLRENLRRRKAQARAIGAGGEGGAGSEGIGPAD